MRFLKVLILVYSRTLFDLLNEKTITVLNGSVNKPKGLIQIVTLSIDALKDLAFFLKQKQFLRTTLLAIIKKPILTNVNVNTHVEKNTNIYNNPENIKRNQELLDEVLFNDFS